MSRSLLILVIAAILACGAGYWLLQEGGPSQEESQFALPLLAEHATDVDRITLSNANGVLLNAQRENDRWQTDVYTDSGELVGRFPVDHEKLASLLQALAQAELVEPKTRKDSNYHHLGLQDISANDSLATLVTLASKGQSWQVLLGNNSTIGNDRYLRVPSQAQAWLSDREINLPLTNSEWLQQPILPFDESDFSSITRVDGASWQIFRARAGESFVLKDQLQTQALKYGGVLDAIALNLAGIHFEQLLPMTSLDWESLTPMVTLDVNTAYGHAFRVEIAQQQDSAYLRIANATPTDYWADWIYQIPKFNGEQLNKNIEDFLAIEAQKEAKKPIPSYPIDEGESPQ